MMSSVFLILLMSSSGYLAEELENEPEYSPASPMHNEPMYASASEMSSFPQHLDLESLTNMPLVILQPRSPLKLNMIRGGNMQDVYDSLTNERIRKLLKSTASSYSTEKYLTPKKSSFREAKSMNFGHQQGRSVFSLPFGGQQSLLPASSNIFTRPFLPHATGGGWQERFRNSFSNMFSFAKPFTGMAATNRPVFLRSPQFGLQIPSVYNPFQSQANFHPGMWNQFQQPHSLNQGDFSKAASFLHPTKLQLGSYFNPYHHSPMHQQQFGGDLAMSGATIIPHRVAPSGSQAFAHYASTVPRHKPLFNNVGGLKGASLEIRNAFADFTASDEHGPEVSQKFGSVGHVMNKFLDMMGLGASGGITDDVDSNFGGAGNWASMDSAPISRSLDFYPGYGNQAHLDGIEDFPIFLEDITEKFLTKMNLTHLLKNDTKTPDTDSMKNPTKEKPSADAKEKPKESSKTKDKSVTKEKMTKPDAIVNLENNLPKYSDFLYVPAQTFEMIHNKNKEKVMMHTEKTKSSQESNMKKVTSFGDTKNASDPVTEAPVANYRVPSTLSTVAPQDRIPPVAIFSSFPSKSNDEPPPPPPSYSPAMQLPQYEFEDNPNKLVDEDNLRPWVPVSNGRGYVEKRPRPFVDITKSSDQPRSLKIVEQVLSGSSRTY